MLDISAERIKDRTAKLQVVHVSTDQSKQPSLICGYVTAAYGHVDDIDALGQCTLDLDNGVWTYRADDDEQLPGHERTREVFAKEDVF